MLYDALFSIFTLLVVNSPSKLLFNSILSNFNLGTEPTNLSEEGLYIKFLPELAKQGDFLGYSSPLLIRFYNGVGKAFISPFSGS